MKSVVFDGCRQQEHRCCKLSGRGKSVFHFGLPLFDAGEDEAVCSPTKWISAEKYEKCLKINCGDGIVKEIHVRGGRFEKESIQHT